MPVTSKKTTTSPLSDRAQELLDLTLSLNKARNIDEILLVLARRVAEICQAEGVTIYAMDEKTNELYSKVKIEDDVQMIRLPISSESVAGYSAGRGRVVNLADVYDADELAKYPGLGFDDTWDKMSGFRTRSVLAVPLRFKDTGLQGVIQLVNHKKGRAFSSTAEKLLTSVARAIAVAFYNQKRIHREPTRFDYLVERGAVTEEEVEKATKRAARYKNDPLKNDPAWVLMHEFRVSKIMMARSLSHHYQMELYEFKEKTNLAYDLIEELNIPIKYLSSNFWAPVEVSEEALTIVTDEPTNVMKVNEIISVINRHGYNGTVRFKVGFREDILRFLDPDFHRQAQSEGLFYEEIADEEDQALEYDENAPTIVKLVNEIIRQAFDTGASDIHIEPYAGKEPTAIRFRQDGVCFRHSEIQRQLSRGVISRFKIMSNLKLDERRVPQSGKIKLKYKEQEVELRVEVTPTYGGLEDVVLRILTSAKPLKIEALNFSDRNYKQMWDMISKPYGIILAVGPTGSGKTTTLHSILAVLNTPEKKIWTVEDPVEITQKGLRQVQINTHIRPVPYSFATAMRSFLRADPDIIMVGEMRDQETAHIAIEASLTGHLVLSTLHTNSAPETVARIVEMGLDPINVSDAILGVLAQRLVRTLCEFCKEKYIPDEAERLELAREYGSEFASELGLDREDLHLYRARGCSRCNETGYRGRTGIHELMIGTRAIKKLVRNKAPVMETRETALQEGMRTLKMDGIQKVIKGQTDLAQVLKVCIE